MDRKILVIDDDPDSCKLISSILRTAGYEVRIATDGEHGIRSVINYHPDLVILDVMMPGLDGYSTCTQIKEMADVPVLLLTAKNTRADVVKGFDSGADDYVKKPYNMQELLLRVGALLRRFLVPLERPSLS
jgi:DNA-binding response OmpR family regulator